MLNWKKNQKERNGRRMEFERKYYEELKKMVKEADEGLKKMNESMTEEEKLIEKEHREQEFQKLLERYEWEQQRTKHVTNNEKETYFKMMVKTGKTLAQKIDADIFIRSNEKYGEICLKTGLILFGITNKYPGKDELILLMRMADNIIVMPEEDAIKWEFQFNFYDTFVV